MKNVGFAKNYFLFFSIFFVLNLKSAEIATSTLSGAIKDSLFGIPESIMGVAKNASTAAIGDTAFSQGGIASLLTNSVTQAKNYVTSKIDWTRQLLPLANFIFYFPQIIVQSFLDNDYEGNTFSIINKDENDEQMSYGIKYDFAFKGSGNANDPFSFDFKSDMMKYFFKATPATFIPEKFYLKNPDGTVNAVQRTDIRKAPFSTILPALLNQLFGAKGIEAWSIFNRFLSLYPEDVALVKIISLLGAAYKNSAAGDGYPRVAHVPLELSVLFSRMAKTPDIQETQKLYPVGTRTSDWAISNVKFLQNGPVTFINNLPDIIKNGINKIEFPVYEGELQEFNDMKGKGVSLAQKLYGQMRGIVGYNARTQFAIDTLLPFVEKNSNISRTEINLLMFAIKLHCCERLDSFYNFFVAATGSVQDFKGDLIVELDSNVSNSLEVEAAKFTNMSEDKIKQLLGSQSVLLKKLLTQAQTTFIATKKTSAEDISFLQTEIALLDTESDLIAKNIDSLAKAVLAQDEATFSAKFQELKTAILAVFNKKFDLKQSSVTGQKIQQKLQDYLTIRYFQFEQLNFKKFDGDVGYFKDNAPMDTAQTILYSMGIVLRAMNDLMKGELLFKDDVIGQIMTSPTGARELIRGNLIYKDYMEKPLYYKKTVENQVADLKTQIANQTTNVSNVASGIGLSPQEVSANDRLAKAQEYYNSLNTVYLQYLRQYKFDRRDLAGIMAGQPFDVNSLTSLVKTKDQTVTADLENAAKKIIVDNKLQGDVAQIKIDALVYKKQLEQSIELLNDSSTKLLQEGALATSNNAALQYQANLDKLNLSKTEFTQKIAAIANVADAALQKDSYTQSLAKTEELITQTTSFLNQAKADAAVKQLAIDNAKNNVILYKQCVQEVDAQLAKTTLTAKTLDEFFPVSGVNLSEQSINDIVDGKEVIRKVPIRENIKKVQIKDADFLKTIIKTRELVAAGKNTQTTTTKSDAATGISAAINKLESILESCEKALQIKNSVLGEKLSAAQAAAITMSNKVLNLDANFASLEKDYLAAMQKIVGSVDLLINTQGFLAAIARAGFYLAYQIFSSSVGKHLFQSCKDAIPSAVSSNTSNTAATTDQSAASAIDSEYQRNVNLLTQTTGSGTDTSIEFNPAMQAEFNDFVNELKSAVETATVWNPLWWQNDIITKPEQLPLMPEERLQIIKAGINSILQAKKTQLTISDKNVALLSAGISLLADAYKQAEIDLPKLKANLELWLGKIKTSGATGNKEDVAVLENINKCWIWLGEGLPFIFSYTRFMVESGTKTSINQFLAKEFANIVSRAPGFAKVASLYLDPILIKSLGVNTKTLLEASSEEQISMASQQSALYAQEFAGFAANTESTLDSALATSMSMLENLAQSNLTMFGGTTYDLVALEKELTQTSSALTSNNSQYMLSGKDFDDYFDSLSTDGANVSTMPETTTMR